MKIAFLTDPLEQFTIHKDSTFAMMQEAARRKHTLYVFFAGDMAYSGTQVVAYARRLTITPSDTLWYQLGEANDMPLSAFDVVVQRKDPPFDMEYLYHTYLLEHAESSGAKIVNAPSAIRNYNEKLSITQFPTMIVDTLVTSDAKRIRAFHAVHQTIILKPLDAMGGIGVFKVGPDALNLGVIIETLTQNGTKTIMVQRYIPEIVSGDKRILLIAGQVVPYALARVPQGTEIRGNLAVGGKGVAQPLSQTDKQMADKLAPLLYEKGLFLVGCDVIGNYLTELNVTSPTCFQEITAQTGCNVAAMFIDALERERS